MLGAAVPFFHRIAGLFTWRGYRSLILFCREKGPHDATFTSQDLKQVGSSGVMHVVHTFFFCVCLSRGEAGFTCCELF